MEASGSAFSWTPGALTRDLAKRAAGESGQLPAAALWLEGSGRNYDDDDDDDVVVVVVADSLLYASALSLFGALLDRPHAQPALQSHRVLT